MRPRYSLARRKAAELLQKANVVEPPVPVDDLAVQAGATIRYGRLEGALSGMLYRAGDESIIGINSAHAHVRQRFSIAHELGHLVMHEPDLRIDEHNFVVFRDRDSSKATDPAEIEANQFAAALLMPEELLRDAVLRLGDKPNVEDAIEHLAGEFKVSREAMTIRLTRLGWITE